MCAGLPAPSSVVARSVALSGFCFFLRFATGFIDALVFVMGATLAGWLARAPRAIARAYDRTLFRQRGCGPPISKSPPDALRHHSARLRQDLIARHRVSESALRPARGFRGVAPLDDSPRITFQYLKLCSVEVAPESQIEDVFTDSKISDGQFREPIR